MIRDLDDVVALILAVIVTAIVVIPCCILIVGAIVTYQVFFFKDVWNWFVPAYFGFRKITGPELSGIILAYCSFHTLSLNQKEDTEIEEALIKFIAFPPLIWLCAYLLKEYIV